MKTFHKIGTNRGPPRIWLDGPRLASCGFTGGTSYYLTSDPAAGILRLSLHPSDSAAQRRVTGRPDGKPIIDITGDVVATTFGAARAVTIHWIASTRTILVSGV